MYLFSQIYVHAYSMVSEKIKLAKDVICWLSLCCCEIQYHYYIWFKGGPHTDTLEERWEI